MYGTNSCKVDESALIPPTPNAYGQAKKAGVEAIVETVMKSYNEACDKLDKLFADTQHEARQHIAKIFGS